MLTQAISSTTMTVACQTARNAGAPMVDHGRLQLHGPDSAAFIVDRVLFGQSFAQQSQLALCLLDGDPFGEPAQHVDIVTAAVNLLGRG